MLYVKGRITIVLLNTGKADVQTEGLDPLQVAQALAGAAAQILGQERAKLGDSTQLIIPRVGI